MADENLQQQQITDIHAPSMDNHSTSNNFRGRGGRGRGRANRGVVANSRGGHHFARTPRPVKEVVEQQQPQVQQQQQQQDALLPQGAAKPKPKRKRSKKPKQQQNQQDGDVTPTTTTTTTFVKTQQPQAEGKKKKFNKKFAPETGAQKYAGAFSSNRRVETNKQQQSEPASPTTPPAKSYNSLREKLTDEMTMGTHECMICTDKIKQQVAIWSCDKCYAIFHLFCIKKWYKQAQDTKGATGRVVWRCPGCQNENTALPSKYLCFCGKVTDPESSYHITPHSCGELCGKIRTTTKCPHPCNITCHPGSCPPCHAVRHEPCHCGKQTFQVLCSEVSEQKSCNNACEKPLNCGMHMCPNPCHTGSCQNCTLQTKQRCFCGKVEQVRSCSMPISVDEDNVPRTFECKQVCGKKLACGNHTCTKMCHQGPCEECSTRTSIEYCPCGKLPLRALLDAPRTSCLDPIPHCESECNKVLGCGIHKCKKICHTGPCGPCLKVEKVSCRCGSTSMNLPCIFSYYDKKSTNDEELIAKLKIQYKVDTLPLNCHKVCGAYKNCNRHKCERKCCPVKKLHYDPDGSHICHITCNKTLNCKKHKCEFPCHDGKCAPCTVVIQEPLTCTCGKTKINPPYVCGTKPPECYYECSIPRACGHAANHKCHLQGKCPPCLEQVPKMCSGGHKMVPNIACCMQEVSCGLTCGKMLHCGAHMCPRICHAGDCLSFKPKENEVLGCKRACGKSLSCSHKCLAECHPGKACNDTICMQKVQVFCPCKRISEFVECKTAKTQFASKHPDQVYAVDKLPLGMIECDQECRIIARNKKLADALQIDAEKSSLPMYTKALLQFSNKNLLFIEHVEKSMEQFLNSVAKSYTFAPMNSQKRQILHELAEHYKFEPMSVDREPNRSVMIDKKLASKKPEFLLSEVTKDPAKLKIWYDKVREFEEKVKQEKLAAEKKAEEATVTTTTTTEEQATNDDEDSKNESEEWDSEDAPVFGDDAVADIDKARELRQKTIQKSKNAFDMLREPEAKI